MEKKNKNLIFLCVFLCLILVLLIGSSIYLQNHLKKVEMSNQEIKVYDKHYVLIAEDRQILWEAIYKAAADLAKEAGAYLEYMSQSIGEN